MSQVQFRLCNQTDMDYYKDGLWLDDLGIGQYKSSYTSLLQFVDGNRFNLGVFVVLLIFIFRQFRSEREKAKKSPTNQPYLEAKDFPEIEALEKFNFEDEEPIKLRQFKPKYFMTMGKLRPDMSADCDHASHTG